MFRKLVLWSFAPLASASNFGEGAGAFVTGFAEGLLGNTEDVEHCAKDLGGVAKAGMSLAGHLGKKNVSRTADDVQHLLTAFQSSVGDCKDAVGDLKPFLAIMKGVHSPGDLYQKLKRNGLDNDEAILEAFEGAGKYCTFREPNGKKCGRSLGRPVRLILLGHSSLQGMVEGPGAFFAGFAEGLIGEADGVKHCSKDMSKVAKAGMGLTQHLGKRNVTKTANDIQHLLSAFQASVGDCKKAAGELKPFLSILKGVHGPADLLQKLKRNGLDNDEAIVDAFEGAGKYCTFREPNGKKCGHSLGRPIRLILLGDTKLHSAVQGPGAFFAGFAEGLIGDADGVKHCSKDLAKVAKSGMSLAEHLGKKNVTRTANDIQHLMNAFQASIGDCKKALGELKPFMSILKGVHGPGDLLQKLKRNGLDSDEAIVEAFEGAGKYCTFREPNGRKCGRSLGRPIRLILLGSSASTVLV